jgi:hypothetical protein
LDVIWTAWRGSSRFSVATHGTKGDTMIPKEPREPRPLPKIAGEKWTHCAPRARGRALDAACASRARSDAEASKGYKGVQAPHSASLPARLFCKRDPRSRTALDRPWYPDGGREIGSRPGQPSRGDEGRKR